MSKISVDVSSARIPVLQVGYQGENEVTDVLFDISSWITEFGEGVAQLRVKRPGNSEEESYVLSLTITDGKAVWTVSETDTANKGNGKVQLSYLVGNIVKKAVIYPYKVGKSIVGADNPVDPFDSWIERSKAWAIGKTLDGNAVPETDETYQNNAKYYAEQADILGSAQVVLATVKANAAAESEANAAASEAAVNGVSTQLTTRMSAIETEQSVQDARMDTFVALQQGSTTGDAELTDIRVGANGTTYDTAGNAVRGQIGVLKSDLDKLEITIPECPDMPIWLCENSTNDYSCPIGQNVATCSLNYSEFLSQYFDVYMTEYNDRYKVTKKSIGRDSSDRYDIYEYTFTPKRYSRTVLISGGMNACELSAEFGIAYFIKNVMEQTNESFKWLYSNVRFKVIPVICPWSFDQSPMKYTNYNGVNLNKNFDYEHSWDNYSAGGAGTKGEYPSSEAETKVLIQWLNNNANKCDFWIDCHTDTQGIAENETANLHAVIGSDAITTQHIAIAQDTITNAYIDAGFFEKGAEKTGSSAWTERGTNYPKTLYGKYVCGIPSIMIEQFVGNPYYGGTKTLNNTEADINNYVTMLRAFIFEILKSGSIKITHDDFAWYLYQWYRDNHYLRGEKDIHIPFTHGGISGSGVVDSRTTRAISEYIELTDNGLFTLTNMSGYTLVDVATYNDYDSFRLITGDYTKTNVGNDWKFDCSLAKNRLPGIKYIRITIKRDDGGVIDLNSFENTEIIRGE